MNWVTIGSIVAGVGVVFGAFGAHGLKGMVDEYRLGVFEKGVFYHLLHAVAIIALGVYARQAGNVPDIRGALLVMLLGILFFSGSLYLLAVTGIRQFGAVTPIGGVLFLVAWFLVVWKSSKGN